MTPAVHTPDSPAFGLYLVITAPRTSHAACAEAAVRAGVRYIQLRMKNAPRDEVLSQARTLRTITAGTDTLFIVNDDPSIAVEVGADGVHLGQTDPDSESVREKWPGIGRIGLSTHNAEQAARAARLAPDLIGVGPVFATPTKAKPDPVLGCAEAGRIIRSVPVPAVAIGGIDTDTLPDVLAAGAVNFAVVRAVCQDSAPFDAIRRLQDIWRLHTHPSPPETAPPPSIR